MSKEELSPIILPATIALLGGIVGYFLKYYLDKKALFSSNNAGLKRDAYQKFVNLTASFFIKSKKSQHTQNNAVEELGEFYKQYVLYGSPKVVRTFANLMQIFYKRETLKITDTEMTNAELKHMIRSMTRVYKAMRKDIGLSNRTLGYGGTSLMRAILTDYDSIMRPKIVAWFSLYIMTFRNKWRRKNTKADGLKNNEPSEEIDEKNVTVTPTLQPIKRNKKRKKR